MPALRYRSRTYKRTFRKTPGGKTVPTIKRRNLKSTTVLNVVNSYTESPEEDPTR
jgi:ribosomal protein L34E